MQTRITHEFDLLQLSANNEQQQSALFCHIIKALRARYPVTFLEINKTYFHDPENQQTFKLTGQYYLVLLRVKETGLIDLDVITNQRAPGAWGGIQDCITLTLEPGLPRSKVERVSKLPLPIVGLIIPRDEHHLHDYTISKEDEKRSSMLNQIEQLVSQQVPHLGAKSIYCLDTGRVGENNKWHSLIMRKLPGRDLFDRIRSDEFYSVEDYLMIGINIIDAVQEQVHDLNLLHRDLKPENMIMTDNKDIYIIDYGFAWKLDQVGNECVGTFIFMAPEIRCCKKASFASDWYSVGVTLADLFGATTKLLEESRETIRLEEGVDSRIIRGLTTLFHDMSELTIRQRVAIKKMIIELCQFDPEHRSTGAEAKSVLEAVLSEIQSLRCRHVYDQNDLMQAHRYAVRLRAQLRLYRLEKVDAAPLLRDVLAIMQSDLAQLWHSPPVVIQHYCYLSSIKSLSCCQSAEEVLSKMNQVQHEYHDRLRQFHLLHEEFNNLFKQSSQNSIFQIVEFDRGLKLFIDNKVPQYSKKIDDIILLNQKLQKRNVRLAVYINQLKKLEAPASASSSASFFSQKKEGLVRSVSSRGLSFLRKKS